MIARTAAEARELMRLVRFDLVIVDQRLGHAMVLFGVGFVLVEEFKQAQPDMFVVMASGILTKETRSLAYRLGADLVVDKIEGARGMWIPVDKILAFAENGLDEPPVDPSVLLQLARVRRDHVIDTLVRCEGNLSVSARQLGIDRRTLRRMLDEWSRLEDPAAARGGGLDSRSDER
jgi:ActR/RegA family two-component response regulator